MAPKRHFGNKLTVAYIMERNYTMLEPPGDLKPGQEQWETFWSHIEEKEFVQYDYRSPNGDLFSTVRRSLGECRRERRQWQAEGEGRNDGT